MGYADLLADQWVFWYAACTVGWPRSLAIRCYGKPKWKKKKNPNELFGQPNSFLIRGEDQPEATWSVRGEAGFDSHRALQDAKNFHSLMHSSRHYTTHFTYLSDWSLMLQVRSLALSQRSCYFSKIRSLVSDKSQLWCWDCPTSAYALNLYSFPYVRHHSSATWWKVYFFHF